MRAEVDPVSERLRTLTHIDACAREVLINNPATRRNVREELQCSESTRTHTSWKPTRRDDLAYVIEKAGEDYLVVGTDYGHADSATELMALDGVSQHSSLTPGVINKIVGGNAQALYNLSGFGIRQERARPNPNPALR